MVVFKVVIIIYSKVIEISFADLTKQKRKFNATGCEGRRFRFGCHPGYGIKTYIAILGRLSPELNLCHNKTQLLCSKDVAYSITKKCNEKQECSFDVTDDELRSRCGRVADISLDVKYFCGKDTFGHLKLLLIFNSLKR